MNLTTKTFVFLLGLTCFMHSASATDYCPKKVGVLSEGSSHKKLTAIYSHVFNALGCDIQIKAAPGQRVIKLLNDGKLDGDLLRFPLIEEKYSFDFIRSDPPVLRDRIKGIYKYPGSNVNFNIPKGIVLGAVWQENYAEAHKTNTMAKTIRYYSYNEVLEAYHNHEISSFLSEQQVIDHAYRIGQIAMKPELHQIIKKDQVHFYLKSEFSEFMQDFNTYVSKHDPFTGYSNN